MDEPIGLRERKKLETRQALSLAALRLAVERGLDNVLVEDIAAAAGVSPRTFNNYFSSKAEAIASRHYDRVVKAAADLRGRPSDEPLWPAIIAATLRQFAEEQPPDPVWTAGVRMMVTEPALVGEFLRTNSLVERELAVAIAERIAASGDDFYPRLVAAAVGAAIQVATEQWLRTDPPVEIDTLVARALAEISAGLPEPEVA
ncbi:TetR family transcriptional regulator [Actinosynnema sp. NPDC020468]|uniref:acyl-CoA-like ligand-binding transcription factor n=1 Tax=Actinosynnema sp. NPDC020468 TaxID=3154488 RepID=UPI003402FE8E